MSAGFVLSLIPSLRKLLFEHHDLISDLKNWLISLLIAASPSYCQRFCSGLLLLEKTMSTFDHMVGDGRSRGKYDATRPG
jgi:hypothetical protein